MKRARIIIATFCCCLLILLGGCGGGEAAVEEMPVDFSKLPPADLVHQLAGTGDVANLEKVLAQQPELLMAPGPNRRSLLHTAAIGGQNNVVEFLLQKGLSPNIPDDQGQYPAEAALNNGHSSTSKLLMNALQKSTPAPAQ